MVAQIEDLQAAQLVLVDAQATFEGERSDFAEQRHQAQEQLSEALETCAEAQKERDDLREQHANISEELDELRARRTFDDGHVEEIEAELEETKAKVDLLEKAVQQAQALESSASESRASYARDVERLEEELNALREAQQDSETSRIGRGFAQEIERSEAQAALQEAQHRTSQLEELVESQRAELRQSQEQLDAVTKERAALSTELDETSSHCQVLKIDLERAQKDVSERETAMTDLTVSTSQDLERLREQVTAAQADVVKAQATFDKLQKQSQEKDALVLSLQSDLQQARDSLSEHTQRSAVTTASSSTQVDVSDYTASPDNTPRRKLAVAGDLVARLRAERDDYRDNADFVQQEQTISVKTLQKQVAALTAFKDDLERQLTAALEELSQQSTRSHEESLHLQEQAKQFEVQLHEARNETGLLRVSCWCLQQAFDGQIVPLTREQEQMTTLQHEAESLRSKTASATSGLPSEAKAFLGKQEELESRIKRRNQQIGCLQNELEQVKSNLAMAEDALVDMERQIETSRDQAASVTEEKQALEARLTQSNHRVDTLENELSSSRATVHQQQTAHTTAASELQAVKDSLDTARRDQTASSEHHDRELLSKTEEVQRLAAMCSCLEQSVSSLEARLTNAVSENQHLSNVSKEASNGRGSAEKQLHLVQQSSAALQAQVDDLEQHALAMSEEHETVLHTLQAQHNVLASDLQGQLQSLKTQATDAESATESLRQQLSVAEARAEALQDEVNSQGQHDGEAAAELRLSLEASEQAAASLKNRLATTEQSLKAQINDSESLRKDAERLKHEMKTLRGLVHHKDEAVTELQRVLEETRTEAESMRRACPAFTSRPILIGALSTDLVSDFNMCSDELERRQTECDSL